MLNKKYIREKLRVLLVDGTFSLSSRFKFSLIGDKLGHSQKFRTDPP